ncbi:MAG: hypothetical protein GAK31_00954 [Stenotrophomonas maltophilia]|uniref:Uncharacterized protein n=1 Tax=Stenotrophomonas maltophilia TaxID=40324 RepID=A0A7V8FKE3_STEMA|nr:MAG: hypothetical protein GAK31_00954 [Stenotrophomonas maltophilia]
MAKAVRAWLQANPSWHFMGEIVAGFPKEAHDKVARAVVAMSRRGQIQSFGIHGTKRYQFGRARSG